jgi:hypothetical protein
METSDNDMRLNAIELAVASIIMALEQVPEAKIGSVLQGIREHRASKDPGSIETLETLRYFDALADL